MIINYGDFYFEMDLSFLSILIFEIIRGYLKKSLLVN